MATIKIKQVKSRIGAPVDQKVEDTPSNRGMIRKVRHLVTVVE